MDKIKFQFFIRGIEVPEPEEVGEELTIKGKGRKRTYKQYLEDLVQDAIDNHGWNKRPTQEEYEERVQQWLNKKKGKGKGGEFIIKCCRGSKRRSESTGKSNSSKSWRNVSEKSIWSLIYFLI